MSDKGVCMGLWMHMFESMCLHMCMGMRIDVSMHACGHVHEHVHGDKVIRHRHQWHICLIVCMDVHMDLRTWT